MDEKINRTALVLDIDWAPDWMIDEVARTLREYNVKGTWFATHDSPAVRDLFNYPGLFEVGLHPNFQPGSSHGADPDEVLSHMLELFPEATSMRTHGLCQSTHLLEKAAVEYGVKVDLSLLLPGARHLAPHVLPFEKGSLLRLPCIWEDDIEMLQPQPKWSFDERFSGPGLAILAFHPVHIVLNSQTLAEYRTFKESGPSQWDSLNDVHPFTKQGPGVGRAFVEACRFLVGSGFTVKELARDLLPDPVRAEDAL